MTAALLGIARFALANWRWLIPLVLFAILAADHGRLRLANAAREAREARAQEKAQKLSDELVIAQAAAMAVTEKKVVSYVDRIRTVQALGWWPGQTYQPRTDDVASVSYWYQREPHAPFPEFPSVKERWGR